MNVLTKIAVQGSVWPQTNLHQSKLKIIILGSFTLVFRKCNVINNTLHLQCYFGLISSIRNWFLDTVAEVNDARILKFLENRFHARDVSVSEAVQAILLSVNHLQPTPALVDMAKVSPCEEKIEYLRDAIFPDTVRFSLRSS